MVRGKTRALLRSARLALSPLSPQHQAASAAPFSRVMRLAACSLPAIRCGAAEKCGLVRFRSSLLSISASVARTLPPPPAWQPAGPRCVASAVAAADGGAQGAEERHRTHLAGTLRADDVGKRVSVCGWVDSVRDLGGVLFFTVRDHAGVVQALSRPGDPADAAARELRLECCVRIAGEVVARTDPNPDMPTGAVEVVINDVELFSRAGGSLPFSVSHTDRVTDAPNEETRLRHRVLDLRRSQMQRNLRLRAAAVREMRRCLEDDHGFLEIETPVLTRSTPEGARDFLVPSRVHPGELYALPQSPQLFKQLLMVASFDRYYQVARCFRDEDLRASLGERERGKRRKGRRRWDGPSPPSSWAWPCRRSDRISPTPTPPPVPFLG